MSFFSPIVAGALYPSVERGLVPALHTARALGGQAFPVCTSLVVAGNGKVTDVLDVPSDTVEAQLEHLFSTSTPSGALVGIVGQDTSVEVLFRQLGQHLQGPLVLNLTLSGPNGEDIADGRVREDLVKRLPLVDLLVVNREDAELLVAMEIKTLDDAQVAVQRLHKLGARKVCLLAGNVPTRTFDTEPSDHMADLYFDGEEFALFEAPVLPNYTAQGASGVFCTAALYALSQGKPTEEALQFAKVYVTESIRHKKEVFSTQLLHYAVAPPHTP